MQTLNFSLQASSTNNVSKLPTTNNISDQRKTNQAVTQWILDLWKKFNIKSER